ncbi:hypothetical protein CARUB_v10010651mg [Capsella rubella]|uniref:Uncharacterized protein n=1 Tax=Capsella rubella TaxID=81985 RepID=R0I8K0_9BRAS|nr:hypothetical protein CARUB_v10010651mg [Capsella rubella]
MKKELLGRLCLTSLLASAFTTPLRPLELGVFMIFLSSFVLLAINHLLFLTFRLRFSRMIETLRFWKSLELLGRALHLHDEGHLTTTVEIMSDQFPLDPPHMVKMLIVSPEFNCSKQILSVSVVCS